jgi:glycosyltransferase involved in cell wall biosynthesis
LIAAASWLVLSLLGYGCVISLIFLRWEEWRAGFTVNPARMLSLLLLLGMLLDHLLGIVTGSLAFQQAAAWGGLVVLGVTAFTVFRRRGDPISAPLFRAPAFALLSRAASCAIVGLAIIAVALAIAAESLREWDARSLWFFHAKVIFLDGGLRPSSFWASLSYDWSNKHYPKLVPMLAARAADFTAGGWNEYAPKLALIAPSAAGFLGLASLSSSATRAALLLLGAVAVLGSSLWNGYMDGLLALTGTVGAGALSIWAFNGGRRELVLGFAALGVALCLKQEGALLFVAALPLVIYGAVRQWPRLSARDFSVVILMTPFLAWTSWKQNLPPTAGLETGILIERVGQMLLDGPALWAKINFLADFAAQTTYLFPILAAFVLIVASLKSKSPPLLMGAVALLYTLGMGAVYLGTPFPFEWHVTNSLDRTAMLPTLLLWAGIVTMLPPLFAVQDSRPAIQPRRASPNSMRLSVLIPVYNERHTIARMLSAVCVALPAVEKEIIIVDDCSTDGTTSFLKQTFHASAGSYSGVVAVADDGIELLPAETGRPLVTFQVRYHERNRGKGGALRTAMQAVTGGVVVVQDADLEYDPQDWTQMYDLIAVKKIADVVYGSRFYGRPHRSLNYHHYLANRLISRLFNILYNQTLSDIEVCYKMFTKNVLDSLALTCDDFGIEVEISAQIARQRALRIYELGISYYGRTYDEGKKINWRDGLKALWYIVKFRF